MKILEPTQQPSAKPVAAAPVAAPTPAAPYHPAAAPVAAAAHPPAKPATVAAVPLPLPAPVIKACARPVAQPELRLAGADGFDRALAARLKSGRSVTVDLAAPYAATGNPPPALALWLSEVRASGGSVTPRSYCQAGRGFGDWLKRVFAGDAAEPGRFYRPARGYDAVLHVDALDQVVTQVQFSPRTARP